MASIDYDKYSINCWSGPRCCSTSLMYSFAQRSDTTVLDEPLYASYLRLTGLARPYREQVLAAQENDGNKVVRDQILGPRSKQVVYAKHIAKQKIGLDPTIWNKGNHILLLRDPYAVVQSFSKVLAPTLQELGYAALAEVYSEMRALGRPPIVILSDDLVRSPEATLRALCHALDLPFQPSMLSWAPGPKPYDGCWAPWWYANSHKSTGFDPIYRDSKEPLPDRLKPLLAECWPCFELLRTKALRPAAADAVARPLVTRTPSTGAGDGRASAPGDAGAAAGAAAAPKGSGGGGGGVAGGTHAHAADPRNANVLVGIRDGVLDTFDLLWRPQAKVSVLDSGFMLGDGVWEGLRVHKGVVAFAAQHIERLWEGCKALDMDPGLSQTQLLQMDPRVTIGRPTIVILPEYKESPAEGGPREKGLRLFTVHVRRGPPDVQDPALNSHSKINCITACIQAAKAGVDEGLMLDPSGFVATCNSTNFAIVRRGEIWAPRPGHFMPGITRSIVLALAAEEGLVVRELDYSLAQVYGADEAFVTGTMAGVLPVVEVDGRSIGSGARGPVVSRLQAVYSALMDREAAGGRAAGLEELSGAAAAGAEG